MTRPVIERLTADHDLDTFDCGVEVLNGWLRTHALKSQHQDGCVTYVAHRAGTVVGFHALVVGSIERRTAPPALTRGMGRYPIPMILLARLAVDHRQHGLGLGAGLLRDALIRCLGAADIAGAKAVVVDAKDGAADFYRKHGFEAFPADARRLYVTMATLRGSL